MDTKKIDNDSKKQADRHVEISPEFRKRVRALADKRLESELAKRANVSQPTISKIVHNERNRMRESKYKAIGKALDSFSPGASIADSGSVGSISEVQEPEKETGAREAERVSPERKTNHKNQRWRSIDRVLQHEEPASCSTDFQRANQLWISGLNLRRIYPAHIADLKGVLARGGKIKIISLEPSMGACKYGAMQDYGPQTNVRNYKEFIEEALERFIGIQKDAENGTNLEIKTIDYPLGFGIDAINVCSGPEGVIYVRYYPLQSDKGDQPIVKITERDRYWYGFYKAQFVIQWETAKRWPGSTKMPLKPRGTSRE